jgi:hypothetical protein
VTFRPPTPRERPPELTPIARDAVYAAQDRAWKGGFILTTAEHLLAGLVSLPESAALRLLDRHGVSRAEVVSALAVAEGRRDPASGTITAAAIVEAAQTAAHRQARPEAGTEHLVLALLDVECAAGAVLRELGLDAETWGQEIGALRPEDLVADRKRVPEAVSPAHGDMALQALCEPATPRGGSSGLTPMAVDAVRAARDRAWKRGCIVTMAEHLLAGMVSLPESVALQLLDRHGVSRAQVVSALAVAEGRRDPASGTITAAAIVEAAQTAARRQAKPAVGTEHLVLALLDAECAAGAALRELGLDAASWAREIEELRPEELAADSKRVPEAVTLALCVMVLQALCWYPLVLGIVFTSHVPVGMAAQLAFAWNFVCPIAFRNGLLRRQARAWASFTGVFFVKTGTGAALLLLLTHDNARTGVLLLLMGYVTVVGALAAGLFAVRDWFGVEPRRGWTTLLRQGRWAILITLLLEAGVMATAMLSRGS